jgi:hypothetical protein
MNSIILEALVEQYQRDVVARAQRDRQLRAVQTGRGRTRAWWRRAATTPTLPDLGGHAAATPSPSDASTLVEAPATDAGRRTPAAA